MTAAERREPTAGVDSPTGSSVQDRTKGSANIDLIMKTKDSNASSYFVTAKINGQYFDALVDNGAAVSVISEELLTRMSPAAVVRPDSRTELRGFGNTVIPVLGDTSVNIEIEDLQASSFRIVVVPRGVTSRPLVLGLDFLEKHFMVIDTVNRLLLYSPPDEYPHSVQLKTSCGLDVQTTVKTVYNVTILPHELKLIKVRLSDMCIPDGSEGYLEPFSVYSTGGEEIKVAYSLNAVANGHIMVELLNVNPSEVQLKRKTKIGIFCVSSNLVAVIGRDGVGEVGESGVSVEKSTRVETSDICAGDLFDFSKSDLSDVQIATVKCMLEKRRAAISLHKHDLGKTSTARHVIDVQGNPPCKQRYRRFQGPLRHEIEEELRKLQDRDIIERSNSPWSSPLVPIRKKDGNLRLCVDYRALNSVTKRDSFPLPNMIDALANLNNTYYFSTFDLMQGFYQMEMDEASKEFTAFSTGDSHWQWKRMPFGLTNSPSSFMQLMALVLAGIPWSIAISYIDDVIITGSTFEDHLANCDLVLSRFEEHGLKVRPDKCSLFRSEVTYLGHTVGRDGVRPDRRNVQAILDFPQPKTQRQVRRYLGMVNFFRRHIPNASTIMKPLNELINQRKLSWTEECNAAFLELKLILTNPPVLSFPDFSRGAAPLIITVDASGVGAGAVLTQQQDGAERPLAYASTTFNQVEVNYSATERELAGLRWAVKTFRPFIYGRKYVIRTDHRALIYLNNMKSVDARLMRTYEELHCGQYEIQFVPGKENVVADALSRMVDLPERSDQVPSNYTVSLQGYKLNVVPGGPDSLFCALALGISGSMDEHPIIRETTVACVLKNPIKYGIGKARKDVKKIEVMKNIGVMPDLCLIDAFVNEFNVNVWLHEDGIGVVKFEMPNNNSVIHLQSLRGVHFNLLLPDGEDADEVIVCHIDSVRARSKEPTVPAVAQPSPVLYMLESDEDLVATPRKTVCRRNKQKRTKLQPENVNIVDQRKVPTQNPVSENLPLHLSNEEIVRLQSQDSTISFVISSLNRNKSEREVCAELSVKPKTKNFVNFVSTLRIVDKILCGGRHSVPVLPACYLPQLTADFHRAAGHVGRDKTIEAISRYYFHPRLAAIVTYVVKRCGVCQRYKGRPKGGAPLYRRHPKAPYEDFAVDLLELPPGKSNVKYLLVGIDTYTKFASAVPLRNKRSDTVARALEERIFSTLVKLPETVTSDNGPEFRGRPFVEMLKRNGVKHFKTVPFAPSCNGSVERLNSTLRSLLAVAEAENQAPWTENLTRVLIVYNHTVHSQTGRAPADFFTEAAAKLPIPFTEPYWRPPTRSFTPFVVGQRVARKLPQLPSQNKLSPKFSGPFVVTEVDPNLITYRIATMDGKHKKTVHFNQLKPWHGEEEAIQQEHGAARQHRPATRSRRRRERPEVPLQSSALGAFSVPPVATSERHNFGEFRINLSGLADKIAAAIRQRADDQPSNVAANNETEEQREEPLSELEEDEQVSLDWEHLSDGLEEVLESYTASPDPVVDNVTLSEPATSSGSSTVVPTTRPGTTTRSQTRRIVEDLVKALTLNAGRESDFLRAADTSYSFTLNKGHPTCLSEDFELPEEFQLYDESVSDGPDLSDHLDREMNSQSDRWDTDDNGGA